MYLVQAESGAAVGYNVLYATLIHGYHIGLTFNHEHPVLACNSFLGLPYTVQFVVLMKNITVGRIDIFLVNAFGTRVQYACREAHNLATYSRPWENNASRVAVNQLVSVVFIAYARGGKISLFIAFGHCFTPKSIAVGEVEAQIKLLNHVVTKASHTEILHANSLSVGMIVEQILKVIRCPLVDNEHRFALALFLFLAVG